MRSIVCNSCNVFKYFLVYSKILPIHQYPNSFVIKLDAYSGEQRVSARDRNSSVPGSTELARIYSMASRPVVETRFSFLLTAAAVTLLKRMQFHLSRERKDGKRRREQLFAYERKIRSRAFSARSRTRRRCC